jgi:bacterioferritin
MKGSPQIIAALNLNLAFELAGMAQYEAHRATLAIWEYPKLVDYLQERIDDERKHFDMLSERIRFLEGIVDAGKIEPVIIGEDIRQMHIDDLNTEYGAIERYNELISLCISLGDAGTRQVIESILSDEEDHARDLEAQLTQIGQMTTQNYLSAKI